MDTVVLYDVERGMGHASGKDKEGNQWLEFEVDAFAEQLPGECAICGAEITEGFTCLDGGEDICHDHVEYAEDIIRANPTS